ncbi:MAG: galactose mutarotase [Tannerella sp.]|jgi:aldose 1-epimerase|nr:galactose mutarotase [Tannerella sp.]
MTLHTSKLSISKEIWGTIDSKPVWLYTLTNAHGVTAKITNYGCILVSFHTPDRNGVPENIVLGLRNLDDYVAGHPCLGNIVGRYANRIGNARFTLNGTEYKLPVNCGKNHIHGGVKTFGHQVWDASAETGTDSVTLSLTYASADGEEGYPGNLSVKMEYVLNDNNELQLHYTAVTDQSTVLNFTNHSYFNLTGCREDVRRHLVKIYAEAFTPVDIPLDEENIPTGEIKPVDGTPYDLREWTVINDRMAALPRGYDNNYCVGGSPENILLAAELYEPESGRLLQTYTTEPGLGFYTACNLDGTKKGPQGAVYTPFMGACFEAQHYPDSPNKPHFPSTVLNPGETYTQVTIYKACIK